MMKKSLKSICCANFSAIKYGTLDYTLNKKQYSNFHTDSRRPFWVRLYWPYKKFPFQLLSSAAKLNSSILDSAILAIKMIPNDEINISIVFAVSISVVLDIITHDDAQKKETYSGFHIDHRRPYWIWPYWHLRRP